MSKSYRPGKDEFDTEWSFVDANGKVLGRLATEIAAKLVGKDKATYTPGVLPMSKVVVTNAAKVAVTGNKESDKVYYRHSNYPGGLRQETLGEMRAKHPERIIQNAVKGMLPNNKLRDRFMANLYVYEGAEHPHTAQEGK